MNQVNLTSLDLSAKRGLNARAIWKARFVVGEYEAGTSSDLYGRMKKVRATLYWRSMIPS
jgi:hypothetical protein